MNNTLSLCTKILKREGDVINMVNQLCLTVDDFKLSEDSQIFCSLIIEEAGDIIPHNVRGDLSLLNLSNTLAQKEQKLIEFYSLEIDKFVQEVLTLNLN